jgi:hypothetical protein
VHFALEWPGRSGPIAPTIVAAVVSPFVVGQATRNGKSGASRLRPIGLIARPIPDQFRMMVEMGGPGD